VRKLLDRYAERLDEHRVRVLPLILPETRDLFCGERGRTPVGDSREVGAGCDTGSAKLVRVVAGICCRAGDLQGRELGSHEP
jgi:hypothetical protein